MKLNTFETDTKTITRHGQIYLLMNNSGLLFSEPIYAIEICNIDICGNSVCLLVGMGLNKIYNIFY